LLELRQRPLAGSPRVTSASARPWAKVAGSSPLGWAWEVLQTLL